MANRKPLVLVGGIITELPNSDVISGELEGNWAPLESPNFTGTPTTPTALTIDNSNQIASTAYVQNLLEAITTAIGGINPFDPVEIKQLYESNADTNAFTDLSKTKVSALSVNTVWNTNGSLPITFGGTGSTTGKAVGLITPRTIFTNLQSTLAVTFDGTHDAYLGVSGTLQPANGGTGLNTANVSIGLNKFLGTTGTTSVLSYRNLSSIIDNTTIKMDTGLDSSTNTFYIPNVEINAQGLFPIYTDDTLRHSIPFIEDSEDGKQIIWGTAPIPKSATLEDMQNGVGNGYITPDLISGFETTEVSIFLGSETWVAPSNGTILWGLLLNGGNSGNAGTSAGCSSVASGIGGSSGSFAIFQNIPLIKNSTYVVRVGAGGLTVASCGQLANLGGTSAFVDIVCPQVNTTQVAGGAAGKDSSSGNRMTPPVVPSGYGLTISSAAAGSGGGGGDSNHFFGGGGAGGLLINSISPPTGASSSYQPGYGGVGFGAGGGGGGSRFSGSGTWGTGGYGAPGAVIIIWRRSYI